MPAGTVVLDARWLGKGGTGTFTTSLLEGLAVHRPDGWTIWGPPEAEHHVWPGATFVVTNDDPVAAFGQRSLRRVPAADLVFHPHQTRPFHRRPAASCVLDLVQLDHRSPLLRPAMAARLSRTVTSAAALFTISEQVRAQLQDRYGAVADDVTVLHLPVDRRSAERVATARARRPGGVGHLVTVGRFAPHKNHKRLVAAFARTRFAADGGELHLVGGTDDDLRRLGISETPGVLARGVLSQPDLEAELAGALALIQPSLQEGHGLPVTEALIAGLPVLSSSVPAAVEHGPSGLPLLEPTDVGQMATAIDAVVEEIRGGRYWEGVDRRVWLDQQPTPATLVEQVLTSLDDRGLPGGGTGGADKSTATARAATTRGESRRS